MSGAFTNGGAAGNNDDFVSGEKTAALTITATTTAECTFTNRGRGHIQVDKVTTPAGDPENFTFDPAGGSLASEVNFDLADTTAVKDFEVIPGTYTVAELAESGWDLTSISCDDSNSTGTGSTATYIVAAGETVKCTFNNRKRGHIQVDKVTTPAGDPENFTFDPAGGSLASEVNFDLADTTAVKDFEVIPGTYTVAELAESGWDLTSISCDDSNSTGTGSTATYIVAAGETVKCTFNNRKRGHIQVDKVTTPAGDPENFTFDPAGGSLASEVNFDLADTTAVKDFEVIPGTYTVAELAESGWDLTSISCDDSNSTGTGSTATYIVAAGETVKCTFNNRKRGHIQVDKVTTPAGDPENFTFDPAGGSLASEVNFDLADTTAVKDFEVIPGTYTVAELAESGWDLTSISCDDSNSTGTGSTATYIVAAGETVKCTFNNRKRGHIQVDKVTTPAGDPENFTFDPAGGSLASEVNFDLADTTAVKDFEVIPGTYTVAELAESGWDLTSISCDDSNSTGTGSTATYIVAAGETVKCTFNNRKHSSITLVKNTVGGEGTFTFNTGGIDGLDTSYTTSSHTDSDTSNALLPGTYSISENVPAGWDLTGSSCSDGSAPSSIGLSAGENVTCTFTNAATYRVIVLVCNESNDDLHPSAISGKTSIGVGDLDPAFVGAFDGTTDELMDFLCNLGGAQFNDLPANPGAAPLYNYAVRIEV